MVWMEVDHVPSACGLTSLTTSAASLLRYTWPHLSQKSRRCPSLAVPGRPTVCMVRSSQVHQVQDQGQNMALLASTTRPMSHGLTFTKRDLLVTRNATAVSGLTTCSQQQLVRLENSTMAEHDVGRRTSPNGCVTMKNLHSKEADAHKDSC